MRLALHERPGGADVAGGPRVVYDLGRGEARVGPARVDGPALVWELGGGEADGAALARDVDLGAGEWVVRCDRVEFPPGGVAYRHVHPGPGIRRLLYGQLTIESDAGTRTYETGEAWFEGADEPVLATASSSEETAFVRILLLPVAWAGRRTIRYLDPADDAKPKTQRAELLLEAPLPVA